MIHIGRNTYVFLLIIILIQLLLHFSVLSNYYFGDEGYHLTYAWLINKGEVIYRDFFSFHSPGTAFALALFFKLFGTSLAIARLLVTLVQMGTTVLIFIMAKKLYDEKTALLSSAVFVVIEVPFWGIWVLTEPFMTFSTVLAAFFLYAYYFENKKIEFLLAAGFFLGLALFFKQTAVLALAMFFLYTLIQNKGNAKHQRLKESAVFLAGCAIVPLLLFSYYMRLGALQDLIYGLITFNFFVVKGSTILMYPSILSIPHIVLIFGPAVYFLLSKKDPKNSFLLIWLFAGFLDAFHAMYYNYHMFPALPPASIMMGCLIIHFFEAGNKFMKTKPPERRPLYAEPINFIAVLVIVTLATFAAQDILLFSIEKNAGIQLHMQIAEYVKARTNENETIFAAPFLMGIHFFSEREPASFYILIVYNGINDEITNRILDDLERGKTRYVVYAPPPDAKNLYKNEKGLLRFLERFESYLKQNYVVEKEFGTPPWGPILVMRRKA